MHWHKHVLWQVCDIQQTALVQVWIALSHTHTPSLHIRKSAFFNIALTQLFVAPKNFRVHMEHPHMIFSGKAVLYILLSTQRYSTKLNGEVCRHTKCACAHWNTHGAQYQDALEKATSMSLSVVFSFQIKYIYLSQQIYLPDFEIY